MYWYIYLYHIYIYIYIYITLYIYMYWYVSVYDPFLKESRRIFTRMDQICGKEKKNKKNESSGHYLGRYLALNCRYDETWHIEETYCQRPVSWHMRDHKTDTIQNTQQHTFTYFDTHYSFTWFWPLWYHRSLFIHREGRPLLSAGSVRPSAGCIAKNKKFYQTPLQPDSRKHPNRDCKNSVAF